MKSKAIAISPKFTTSQLPLHTWKALKDFPGGDAFEKLHKFGYRIPWWESQEYMDMILCNFHRFDFEFMNIRNLLKAFFDKFSKITSQYPFAIFWGPYQMVTRVVNSMTGSFDRHAVIVNNFSMF